MKKNKWLLCALMALFTTACSNEDNDLTPSGTDINYYELEDSSDPVDHSRYVFYKETGVPVFYNDTIGTQQRTDRWGNTYTHYEKLNISASSLGGVETTNPFYQWDYCQPQEVEAGLNFLRSEVLPVLPSTIKIHSVLLVNKLYTYVQGISTDAYKGLNTVLVSRIGEIPTMTAEQKAAYRASVLCALVATPIATYKEELEDFYEATRAFDTKDSYGRDLKMYGCSGWYFYSAAYVNRQDPHEVGFLKEANPYDYSSMPDEKQDLSMYLAEIFTLGTEGFEAKYAEWDVVMTKYRLLLGVLQKIGFEL